MGDALVCVSYGWPPPEVEWQRNRQSLSNDSGVVSESSTVNSATVSAQLKWTREFVSSDAGSYQCIAHRPNATDQVEHQSVLLKAINVAQTAPPLLACNESELMLIYFQIRVLATDCEHWEKVNDTQIASSFHRDLLSIVRTKCNCEVSGTELVLLGSPHCSSKAAIFQGKIELSEKSKEIYCNLLEWQKSLPLVRVNDHFQAVDVSFPLKVSSLNNDDCNTVSEDLEVVNGARSPTIVAIVIDSILLIIFFTGLLYL